MHKYESKLLGDHRENCQKVRAWIELLCQINPKVRGEIFSILKTKTLYDVLTLSMEENILDHQQNYLTLQHQKMLYNIMKMHSKVEDKQFVYALIYQWLQDRPKEMLQHMKDYQYDEVFQPSFHEIQDWLKLVGQENGYFINFNEKRCLYKNNDIFDGYYKSRSVHNNTDFFIK